MRSFFYCLDRMIFDSQDSGNIELFNFSQDVKSYIFEGTFTKYKKVKTVLSLWGMTDKKASMVSGMNESTLRTARVKLSNELYELLGYDFFTVVGIGDKRAIAEGRARLNLAKRGFQAEDYISYDLIRSISAKAMVTDDIDITTCGSEIQFLVRHSKQNIEREMAMLDANKLGYLLRMLNNEVDSLSNIRRLVNCFERNGK